MEKKQIHQKLRNSLEFKHLWNYFKLTAVIMGVLIIVAVVGNPKEGLRVAAAIYGVVMSLYLLLCIIRTVNIFRSAEDYAFCRATLTTPHGGLLRDTIYFTALVEDPDTGEKFHADTHAIFFTHGILQPLLEDYANATVTLACNRKTGMVVVIG